MNPFRLPWTILRKRSSSSPTWDVHLPVVGIVFLFLEVSPRPIFGWNLESARILAQFPLLAAAFLAAWERRFAAALASALALAALQALPGASALLHGAFSLDAAFPVVAWTALLLSYLHPARRVVYLEPANTKESKP